MPKEIVYGRSLPYGDDEPARSIVEVRWDRETGYFQMVTRCVRADNLETYVPSRFEITSQGTAGELTTSEQLGDIPVQEGFWVDLDRAGINAVIKNLRRARDQAFGRDE